MTAGMSVVAGALVADSVASGIALEVGASVAVAGAQAASTRVAAKRRLGNSLLFICSLFSPLHIRE